MWGLDRSHRRAVPANARSRKPPAHQAGTITGADQRRRQRQSFADAIPTDGRRYRALLASALAAVAFVLYFVTLAPSITWKLSGTDSGDLASAVATWGIPHPTGYPLYIALGGIVTHLIPVGQIAYRLGLFSAACSAGATALVFLTVLRLSDDQPSLSPALRSLMAATAALAFATARAVWSQSVLTEGYALEALFAAAIAWLLAERRFDRRRLLLLALISGLALTHHTTIVFSLCGAIVAAVARYRRRLLDARLLGTGTMLFALPLLLYLLLPWRAAQHPASNWSDPTTFGRFVDVVTGAPYHYLVDHNIGHALRAIPAVVQLAFRQFAWWMVPLAVVGIVGRWTGDAPYAAYLAIVAVIAGLFLAVYDASGSAFKYAVQGDVVLSIAGGAGLLVATDWLRGLLGTPRRRWLPWITVTAAAATVLPAVVLGLGEYNLRDDWTAWEYARQALAAAPAGSTILTDTDEHTFALWYAQRAGRIRPDVHVVDVRFLDPIHQR